MEMEKFVFDHCTERPNPVGKDKTLVVIPLTATAEEPITFPNVEPIQPVYRNTIHYSRSSSPSPLVLDKKFDQKEFTFNHYITRSVIQQCNVNPCLPAAIHSETRSVKQVSRKLAHSTPKIPKSRLVSQMVNRYRSSKVSSSHVGVSIRKSSKEQLRSRAMKRIAPIVEGRRVMTTVQSLSMLTFPSTPQSKKYQATHQPRLPTKRSSLMENPTKKVTVIKPRSPSAATNYNMRKLLSSTRLSAVAVPASPDKKEKRKSTIGKKVRDIAKNIKQTFTRPKELKDNKVKTISIKKYSNSKIQRANDVEWVELNSTNSTNANQKTKSSDPPRQQFTGALSETLDISLPATCFGRGKVNLKKQHKTESKKKQKEHKSSSSVSTPLKARPVKVMFESGQQAMTKPEAKQRHSTELTNVNQEPRALEKQGLMHVADSRGDNTDTAITHPRSDNTDTAITNPRSYNTDSAITNPRGDNTASHVIQPKHARKSPLITKQSDNTVPKVTQPRILNNTNRFTSKPALANANIVPKVIQPDVKSYHNNSGKVNSTLSTSVKVKPAPIISGSLAPPSMLQSGNHLSTGIATSESIPTAVTSCNQGQKVPKESCISTSTSTLVSGSNTVFDSQRTLNQFVTGISSVILKRVVLHEILRKLKVPVTFHTVENVCSLRFENYIKERLNSSQHGEDRRMCLQILNHVSAVKTLQQYRRLQIQSTANSVNSSDSVSCESISNGTESVKGSCHSLSLQTSVAPPQFTQSMLPAPKPKDHPANKDHPAKRPASLNLKHIITVNKNTDSEREKLTGQLLSSSQETLPATQTPATVSQGIRSHLMSQEVDGVQKSRLTSIMAPIQKLDRKKVPNSSLTQSRENILASMKLSTVKSDSVQTKSVMSSTNLPTDTNVASSVQTDLTFSVSYPHLTCTGQPIQFQHPHNTVFKPMVIPSITRGKEASIQISDLAPVLPSDEVREDEDNVFITDTCTTNKPPSRKRLFAEVCTPPVHTPYSLPRNETSPESKRTKFTSDMPTHSLFLTEPPAQPSQSLSKYQPRISTSNQQPSLNQPMPFQAAARLTTSTVIQNKDHVNSVYATSDCSLCITMWKILNINPYRLHGTSCRLDLCTGFMLNYGDSDFCLANLVDDELRIPQHILYELDERFANFTRPHLFAKHLTFRLFSVKELRNKKFQDLDARRREAIRNCVMQRFNINHFLFTYVCQSFINTSISHLFRKKLKSVFQDYQIHLACYHSAELQTVLNTGMPSGPSQ